MNVNSRRCSGLKMAPGLLLLLATALAPSSWPQSAPLQQATSETVETSIWQPKLHFNAPPYWFNDPNGPIYINGQYNIFFQLNPFGDQWGHMTWGHAVSTDLIHWKQLPAAIPEENGIMIFSGSTVEDRDNTSGLCGEAGKKTPGCIVAVYTGHTDKLQTQNLAVSRDAGATFIKFSGNPVLDIHRKDFRDPKVFWHAPSHAWVMVVSIPDEHKVRFYRSKNLREWEQAGEFGPAGAVGGVWECPDLFELPVKDAPGKHDSTGKTVSSRWVLNVNLNPGGQAGGSGDQYFIGQFDGSHFTEDHPGSGPHWVDWGKDFYASTSFADTPAAQGKLLIGWMSNWLYADKLPSLPGRGEMTIVRRLYLREAGARAHLNSGQEPLQLVQEPVIPVPELKPYNAMIGAPVFETLAQANAQLATARPPGSVYVLRLDFDAGDAAEAGISLRRGPAGPDQQVREETLVGINTARGQIFVDRTHSGKTDWSPEFPGRVSAPLKRSQANSIPLEIVVDSNSVEVFAEDGETVLTSLIFPSANSGGLSFYSTPVPPGSAPPRVRNVQLFRLDPNKPDSVSTKVNPK